MAQKVKKSKKHQKVSLCGKYPVYNVTFDRCLMSFEVIR